MKDFPIFFVSGLPRSCSTLLVNLLGQNPKHHVTPTSGLIELFMKARNGWKDHIEFKSTGLEIAKPKVLSALKGLLYGYFDKQFEEGQIVFDKSRGWLQYIEELEEVLGREIKILVPIRDVRDICASFEKIYQNRKIEYVYPTGEAFFKTQTIEGRCEHLLSDGGVVGLTINRLRDALSRKINSRVVLIPANSFTTRPVAVMNQLHHILGLEPFIYNINVEQVTHENDLWHGMNLHTIQSPIKPLSKDTWKGILPKVLADEIGKRYADIAKLCED